MTDTSRFDKLPEIVIDPILGLQQFYNQDKNPNKLNLTIGLYKDENGKSWILPSVWKAMKKVEQTMSTDYLKPQGDAEFTRESIKLAYGFENGLYCGKY